MRGRKPKSRRQRELEGNPGKRPLPKELGLPLAGEAFDTPPAELAGNPTAAAEWCRVAPMLRRARAVTEGDRAALLALCTQWARYVDASRALSAPPVPAPAAGSSASAPEAPAGFGMLAMSPNGYPMVNPLIGIADRALKQCVRLWAEFGLTPSSRTRVAPVTSTPSNDPANAFAEFDDDAPGAADGKAVN